MSHDHHHHLGPFPRGPLLGAGGLVLFALLAVGAVRVTGAGNAADDSVAVVARDLRFEDRPDGGVAVLAAAGGEAVEILPPGTNGFVRATLRGLARDRKRRGEDHEIPFRLTGWADGRLTLEDLATGRRVGLEAFGPTNAEAFSRFLAADGGKR